jgi:hypothetical protein
VDEQADTRDLSTDDPVLALENAILNPPMGYYSGESLRNLRRMATARRHGAQ